MTTREKLEQALDAAISGKCYAAIAPIAAELRQWSTHSAWSRLDLTAEEAEVAEEIVATTSKSFEYGDAVWIKGRLMEERADARLRYRVNIDDANASFWVSEVMKRSLPNLRREEPEPLKFGQWVQMESKIGIVLQYDIASGGYMVWWEDNNCRWYGREQLTPIEPQS